MKFTTPATTNPIDTLRHVGKPYDRIDGLSVGLGPTITLATGRIEIEPSLTYRSHLGAVDPSVAAVARFGRLTSLRILPTPGTVASNGPEAQAAFQAFLSRAPKTVA